EGNNRVWGSALLGVSYGFMRQQSETLGLGDPPFEIPKFRFVEMALAIEQGKTNKEARVFLLEEEIRPEVEGPFKKYINNDSAKLFLFFNDEDNHRAEFLAFTQHVQYFKTKKCVFVSDYQGELGGGKTLLTDPQIVTKRELGPVFTSGNIPEAFENFEKEHECNKFCEFFRVP
ncbi:kinase-like protein, partial [Leucogyrophana mollusca]